jgi:hypothetical protein
MGTGTPPSSWPERLPGTRGGKMNSSSPSRPRGTAVRRKAPTSCGQDRSGHNRAMRSIAH